MDSFYLVIFWITIGLVPAIIASYKGKNFWGWWLYGFALFPVAFLHILLSKPDQKTQDEKKLKSGMVKCPFCAELIRSEARVCRYCHRDLSTAE